MFKMLVSLEFPSYRSFIIFFLTFPTFLLNFYDTFTSGNPFRNIRHIVRSRIEDRGNENEEKKKGEIYDSS